MHGIEEERHSRFLKHLEPLERVLEAYCRRSVHRSSEAEDVLQNAVLKAYRDFSQYVEGTNFRAWIFRYLNLEIYAGNRSISRNTHEALATEPVHPRSECEIHDEDSSLLRLVKSPGTILEGCDQELASAIRDLDATERSAFLLRAIGNLKYREIAEVLEIPIGTVMSHLSRGRRILRERLSEWSRKRNSARCQEVDAESESGHQRWNETVKGRAGELE